MCRVVEDSCRLFGAFFKVTEKNGRRRLNAMYLIVAMQFRIGRGKIIVGEERVLKYISSLCRSEGVKLVQY